MWVPVLFLTFFFDGIEPYLTEFTIITTVFTTIPMITAAYGFRALVKDLTSNRT